MADNKVSRWDLARQAGKCFSCKNPAVNGSGYCELHLDKRRQYMAKRRKVCCPCCGGKIEISGHCKLCWDKILSSRYALRTEKKLRGECLSCDKPAVIGRVHCELCASKLCKQRAKLRQERINAGFCVKCGNKQSGKSGMCSKCYAKEVSFRCFDSNKYFQELIDLMHSQKNTCPYTGLKIELGDNASLDHKTPVSRGGENSLDNMQWVYLDRKMDINRMKWDLTDQEFREAISVVFNNIITSLTEDISCQ